MNHPQSENREHTTHSMVTDVNELELERDAHRLAVESQLSDKEALVVEGVKRDMTSGEIGSVMGRSGGTVERIRERLRERRHTLREADADILEDI